MTPIVGWGARGDGVAADGRFVAGAVPGDAVGDDGALVPGAHHRVPPCRHFPACGGCQLQHADDVALGFYLRDRIVAALAGQHVPVPEMAVPQLSPPRSRRRATLHAVRVGQGVELGFKGEKSSRIIDMLECHVILPELFALVAPLRRLLAALLPARGAAEVMLTRVDQGIDLLLKGRLAEGLATAEQLGAFAREHQLARLAVDEGWGPETRWEPVPVAVSFGGSAVAFPPGGFLQATADGEAALVAAVRAGVGDARPVADLFAGLGTFALPLRAAFAVEGSRDAAAALLATRRCQVAHRDLFRRPLTAADLAPFAAVVLDPPRAGAWEQVKQLAASGVPRLAYVSCNPATFARDAAVLVAGGYRLARITPVGQFRWATHVELVGAFER